MTRQMFLSKTIPDHDCALFVVVIGSDQWSLLHKKDSTVALKTHFTVDCREKSQHKREGENSVSLEVTDHISSICKKASQRIGVLMRLGNLIPTKAKLVLFKSAVLPYLTYCHLVWHFCKSWSSDARKLERLQERGLRAVYRDKHASYSQLLKRAELRTLMNRRL